jgi:hypothetical protein
VLRTKAKQQLSNLSVLAIHLYIPYSLVHYFRLCRAVIETVLSSVHTEIMPLHVRFKCIGDASVSVIKYVLQRKLYQLKVRSGVRQIEFWSAADDIIYCETRHLWKHCIRF